MKNAQRLLTKCELGEISFEEFAEKIKIN